MQVSEIVYVHSKCMIADDRVAIIGSCEQYCSVPYYPGQASVGS